MRTFGPDEDSKYGDDDDSIADEEDDQLKSKATSYEHDTLNAAAATVSPTLRKSADHSKHKCSPSPKKPASPTLCCAIEKYS